MKVPEIFRWPTPWAWGALAILIWSTTYHWEGWVIGLCLLTIAASVVKVLHERVLSPVLHERLSSPGRRALAADEVGERLAQIERRLTDTQEVMIALSDKMDRWEEGNRKESEPCTMSSP